ncbi:hypothetical protein ONZ43_g3643 [Nemania bipapillata]|uniref:Uncharacterized protein n=1 Tax=Nemania bipapillata TaxID=110536 RepID=A0ACC2IW42_9PEZI|nr:hypothetical protein ONZ43_g3643 [Nemania bipapillata]
MCISCTKTRKTCTFRSPPDRTPLTRKNLDAAELQIAQLRTLVKSLQPNLDIDAAIRRLRPRGGTAALPAQLDSPPAEAETDRPTPQNYEWHEGSLSESTGRTDRVATSNDESGTAETVQAFLLLGNYLQKRDRPNTGYNFVGLAWKLALGLGLHREVPKAVDTVEYEMRRSLFWVMYCFDNGFNITTGRPPTLSDGFIDTRLPRNIDYKEFLLAKTAGTKIEYRLAELIEKRLSDWQRDLPAYFTSDDIPCWFRAPRAIVLWKEQNLRILLWRGSRDYHSFLPSKPSAEAKCLGVAMRSIHDIATFCEVYETDLHRGIAWYAIYFLFQAALVLEASYLQSLKQKRYEEDNTFRDHSLFQMRACMSTLAETNRSARRCLEVLDNIHGRLCSEAAVTSRMTVSNVSIDGTDNALMEPYRLPSPGFVGGEDPYTMFENGLSFGDDVVDPTLRLLINPNSSNMFEDMPLDALLDNWIT